MLNLQNIFLVKKQIVYQATKFGIQSLFILIQFETDQIVHDRLNIAVTKGSVAPSSQTVGSLLIPIGWQSQP